MSTDDDALVATIDELMHNFRSALVAVIPPAERAKLSWSDSMNQHPSWEKLQGCLFDVFVAQPVSVDRSRTLDQYPTAPYDIDVDDYSSNSWIACEAETIGRELAFVRFTTDGEPFNRVQIAE